MTTIEQVLAMALGGTTQARRADAPAKVRAEVSAADLATAEVGQVLCAAFAQVSQLQPPQVAEPIELLWRNAARARDDRGS